MTVPELNPQAVLDFWFAGVGDDGAALKARHSVWYSSDARFDDEIRQRFGALVDAAAQGELKLWKLSPAGTLALIVVCDQFPRNIFRATPRAFALDQRAQALARDGVAQGIDRGLSIAERSFFYLPFEHAEDREAQAQSLRCFEQLHADAPAALRDFSADALHWSRDHHDIVQRFGRFPHRNLILDRDSTPEELAFLAAHRNTYGQG
ncbi:MAG: DUF924 domain-containing protein [Gammaproteobacteria bacterium]|nr:DUF924 domain-containing protein [Gammaproteobacteria bacterium]